MAIESAAAFRRYRAPLDGETLVDPSWARLPAIVDDSRQRLGVFCYDLNGRCLSELSATARRRLVEQSLAYTRQYRDVTLPAEFPNNRQSTIRSPKSLPPIILSGHQPQLFHPGVWYKNFVLGALARQVGGVGIHFLIDSDLCRSVSLRVPTGSRQEPRVETVSYDLPADEMPYEERAIRDPATFQSFGRRAAETLRPLVSDPLLEVLWPLVTELGRGQQNLGLCLAQARHQLEVTWQNNTLELPQMPFANCQSSPGSSPICWPTCPDFAWRTTTLWPPTARHMGCATVPSRCLIWGSLRTGTKCRSGCGPATIRSDGRCSRGSVAAMSKSAISTREPMRWNCRPTRRRLPRSTNYWSSPAGESEFAPGP